MKGGGDEAERGGGYSVLVLCGWGMEDAIPRYLTMRQDEIETAREGGDLLICLHSWDLQWIPGTNEICSHCPYLDEERERGATGI